MYGLEAELDILVRLMLSFIGAFFLIKAYRKVPWVGILMFAIQFILNFVVRALIVLGVIDFSGSIADYLLFVIVAVGVLGAYLLYDAVDDFISTS